ncbi:aspartic peptidase domain-containing protein [Cladorrhinum sp. PSN332]|nr:aspartic peptidase domain-containing protein [Cladorrhinum sp. PSN332]
MVDVLIGTPRQAIRLGIDINSPETWVNPSCSKFPGLVAEGCIATGIYDPDESETSSTDLGLDEETITYARGASATFDYVKDEIHIPGNKTHLSTTITDFQFGVAKDTDNLFTGILGLGRGNNQSALGGNSFLDRLWLQMDQSEAMRIFSMALGDDTKNETGSLIFGGLDNSKFTGHLVSIPVHERSSRGYVLKPSGFVWNSRTPAFDIHSNLSTQVPAEILLNATSPRSTLSALIVVDILKTMKVPGFESMVNPPPGPYMVPCTWKEYTNMTFTFIFERHNRVKMSLGDFIRQIPNTGTCMLTIEATRSPDEPWVLGSMFFRKFYLVFDHTRDTVSVARYVNCGTDEELIGINNMYLDHQGGLHGYNGWCREWEPAPAPTASPKPSHIVLRPQKTWESYPFWSGASRAGCWDGLWMGMLASLLVGL